jgi:hypothetical protein
MRNHFEDFWGLYAILGFCAALLALLIIVDTRHRAAVNNCYDQGMILVETDAGHRCAPLDTLSR